MRAEINDRDLCIFTILVRFCISSSFMKAKVLENPKTNGKALATPGDEEDKSQAVDSRSHFETKYLCMFELVIQIFLVCKFEFLVFSACKMISPISRVVFRDFVNFVLLKISEIIKSAGFRVCYEFSNNMIVFDLCFSCRLFFLAFHSCSNYSVQSSN